MIKLIHWNDFINLAISCNGVICIGAGKRLESMAQLPITEEYLKSIKYVVDNDKEKQGKTVKVGTDKRIVMSVEQLRKCNIENMVILITIAEGYLNIIEQLKILGIYEQIDVYCLTHIKNIYMEDVAMSKKIPDNIMLSEKMLIPKKIHYCWFGGSPLPDKYKKWMESWKKYCPDYEIIEWNESNYDITKNKYMYDAYKAKKWGFVPDYARLDIIYNHGGIYLDTDVELVANLDDLLYEEAFAGFESEENVALGLGFGAQKGNPIIKEMRDDYKKREFIRKDGRLNLIASPIIQTEILNEKGLVSNGEYQKLDNITIFPEKMLCGKSMYTRRILLKNYTRAIHHYEGTWLEDDIKTKIYEKENEFKELIQN